MSRCKGILLYSGGLDSLITAKVLLLQDIELTGFHCLLPFYPPDFNPGDLEADRTAREIGLPVYYHRLGKEYLEIAANPPHGYGQHMNPCIDCKTYFIQLAGEYMKFTGADFVATGEVVGQRPMSQMKHMLNHIEKASGIPGRLLRPLSAKILKPTIPELEGKIDREKLLGINGRSRKVQMSMAHEFNLKHYSSPSGGCLFTDPNIARRIKDLFDHHNDYTPLDMYFLTLGRHFRITSELKIIVPRNEKENIELEKYSASHDYLIIPEFKGPLAAIKGNIEHDDLMTVLAILARYGKPGTPSDGVALLQRGEFRGHYHAEVKATQEMLTSMIL